MTTVCPLRPVGGRPDAPSDNRPPPVRLVRRARHHQCRGLRALPEAGPVRHCGLHGQRRRQGHPCRGVPRRGHHHARRRGRPPRSPLGTGPRSRGIWFATSRPAYLDKTNATAVAAALRLPGDVGAYDFGGALRSGIGCLIAALRGGGTTLVVAGDMRDGLPTSGDESAGGDAGAAALVGEGPRSWPSWSPRPRRRTNSPTAGGPRATAPPSSGRSGSGRTDTWRWGRMPWSGR